MQETGVNRHLGKKMGRRQSNSHHFIVNSIANNFLCHIASIIIAKCLNCV